MSLPVLAVLLVLPVVAVDRQGLDLRWGRSGWPCPEHSH